MPMTHHAGPACSDVAMTRAVQRLAFVTDGPVPGVISN